MTEFEKDSIAGSHAIESSNILTDKETGRVVAVFYNDYDLDDVLALQTKIKELEVKLAASETNAGWAEEYYTRGTH